MRDHERVLAEFCGVLARRGMASQQIDELVDHLQCSVAQQVEAGVPIGDAMCQAIRGVGDVFELTREYRKESVMHPLQKLLGLVFVFCVIFVATTLQGGHVSQYLSGVSIVPLLMICGVTIGGLVASFGMRRTVQMCSVAVLGRTVQQADAVALQQVCQRGQRLAWTGCMLSVTLSAMHICSVLDHPSLIGPGIGWMLLSVVYAALLADLGFGSAERWIVQQTA